MSTARSWHSRGLRVSETCRSNASVEGRRPPCGRADPSTVTWMQRTPDTTLVREPWHKDRRNADRVVVRPVRDRRELDHVRRLVHDVYLDAGYIAAQPGGRLVYCPHLDVASETTAFIAEAGGEIVGTCSLTLDGPAGFHLDDEYPDALRAIRREVPRLASSWRWASKAPATERIGVYLGLLRAIQAVLHANAVETCLFTLVPHFAQVYRNLLNARLVASTPPLHGCASKKLSMFRCGTVLMRWDVERCPPRWFSRLAGSLDARGHGRPV